MSVYTTNRLWVIAGIALVVGLGAFFFLRGKHAATQQESVATQPRPEMLTSDAYHAVVRQTLDAEGLLAHDVAADAAARAAHAEAARMALLGVVIPASEREAHLALLLALGQIASGTSAAQGEAALQQFLDTFLWARAEAPIAH